ncbi:hypothetical protein H5410_014734 [Solanum commersonii]|uniref:Uncharacterized protein n=1 Tax=Solanum commersonii TaxID=4109 RepID=A0A9J5ZRS5_SOLCO|nr:hypothetical protein H5410_014734 [Solanum commersonii]
MAMACTNQLWRVRIGWATSAVACTHRPCDARQKLEASAKACTHLTSHVRIGQTTSAKGSGISRGLHSSTVACEHRLGDIGVGQWHAASNKAWTHLMWHVRSASAVRQRQCKNQGLAHIRRGCATAKRRRQQQSDQPRSALINRP